MELVGAGRKDNLAQENDFLYDVCYSYIVIRDIDFNLLLPKI